MPSFKQSFTIRFARRFAVIIACVLLALYFYHGSHPDPRFTLSNLKGLTPSEVSNRLGPPVVDPRLAKWGGWTPNNEKDLGPLRFYYYDRYGWKGYEYAVVFENGKVVDVKYGTK
jgi:hypothetical protein